jgi:hypothetical protein
MSRGARSRPSTAGRGPRAPAAPGPSPPPGEARRRPSPHWTKGTSRSGRRRGVGRLLDGTRLRYSAVPIPPAELGRACQPLPRVPDKTASQNANKPRRSGACSKKIRQRPTLPGERSPSTIGAGGLNFRVRNGNGCNSTAIATGKHVDYQSLKISISEHKLKKPSPRPISTGQLSGSLHVHIRPINVVVYYGPYQVDPVGDLILRRASHLDAFSAYPFRRWQTSRAFGKTTGTPELRPSRSSRTRDSLSQISSDCSG